MTVNHALIIGLSGYAQSGKDTVGSILVEQHGFQRFAFADYLREVCCAFDPIIDIIPARGMCGCMCHNPSMGMHVKHVAACCNPTPATTLRFAEALKTYGYEKAKATFPEFRRALQYMGTEVVRQKIKDSFWVDHVFEQIDEIDNGHGLNRAVITDARFENEVRAVERQGGYSVWVSRPGVGPVNSHASDNSLDQWVFDTSIDNDGSLEDLDAKVDELVACVERECA